MRKFGVAENEQPTRTSLEGLANAAVRSNHPLKQGRRKVTLKLVVNRGNVQVITMAPQKDKVLRILVNLERDFTEWMRRVPHTDMERSCSMAIKCFRVQLSDCPNTNSQVPEFPEYSEAINAVAD